MFLYLSKHKLKKHVLNKDINYVKFNALEYIDSKVNDVINNPVFFLSIPRQKYSKVTHYTSISKKDEPSLYKPVIYLYNTHQGETYSNYTVYDATYKLANELYNDNYYTYFEENSIPTFLNNNKMKYSESYKASRYYLNKTYENYNTLKYFFDIHRDSISKDKVTLNYKGNNYSKVLFLIGLENTNYEQNYEESKKLSDIINKHVPGLSKGIYKKGGKKVNGVYNQDFGRYVFLIEVGAKDSKKEEVENTIGVLKESIKEYVNETNQL